MRSARGQRAEPARRCAPTIVNEPTLLSHRGRPQAAHPSCIKLVRLPRALRFCQRRASATMWFPADFENRGMVLVDTLRGHGPTMRARRLVVAPSSDQKRCWSSVMSFYTVCDLFIIK